MRDTPYKGYALYEPDASPDLTETGEYNSAIMAIDADMHDEEQARIEADTALNVALANETAARTAADAKETNDRKAADAAIETAYKAADTALGKRIDNETAARSAADTAIETAYKAADTALGKRVDNAEAEISANSADLTGIKGLTYGEEHVNFIEESNGEYSSPALEEINEQMKAGTVCIVKNDTDTELTIAELATIDNAFPAVSIAVIYAPSSHGTSHTIVFMPSYANTTEYSFTRTQGAITDILTVNRSSRALTYDQTTLSSGVTGTTQWGEIES